ncbi:MAG TPA: toll/interleukin-1 receptor domain-containing protein, partial [Baekduia sp.]|nr:toll/interleukin-1 receptor domain-containing protein [Baekduia sp.]
RAMVPLLGPSGPRTAAMPIVATGDAGYPVGEMLDAILVAAGHWMALDVSLERLLIVQPPDSPRLAEALDAFERAKASHLPPDPRAGAKTFDFFVSYAHEDSSLADAVVETLRRSRPGIQIFLDRLSLSEGDPWQQELFTAMDWSRKVVALLSPNYIGSKMCLEEYNIARILDRESDERVLLPLYVHSADLATYMRAIQYRDCREADLAALRAACTDIADSI